MAGWNAGYIVDIEYTHGFYRELAPSLLSFAALMQGVSAPGLRVEPLAYCELGCGQGVSTNVLAAANPHVEFHATEFNPSHVAGAEALAGAARLPNVHFFDDSFAEFLERDDLPDFDIVALHGIYSWISPENRRTIVEFIRRKLKPGGLVYASYNVMPGWASVMPLRRLLVEYADRQATGSRAARIRAAVDFAERLSALGTRFFAGNPKLAERLKLLKTKDPHYIAHEYFNADHNPFYFMDVAEEFAEAKLRWIGSASPLETIDEINLSADQRKMLAEIDDIALRETLRDHIVDQGFRKDVFIKGPVRMSRSLARERWLDTRFALTCLPGYVPSEVQGRGYSMKLQPDFHRALTSALDGTPRSLREIMASPGLEDIGLDKVIQSLVCLVGQGNCHPGLDAQALAERKARTEAFNEAVATRNVHEPITLTFASPVTGSGVRVDQMDQMIWLGRRRREADIPDFVWRCMMETGHRLAREGKPLTTREEHVAELQGKIVQFDEKIAPVLAAQGIDTGPPSPGKVQDLRRQA